MPSDQLAQLINRAWRSREDGLTGQIPAQIIRKRRRRRVAAVRLLLQRPIDDRFQIAPERRLRRSPRRLLANSPQRLWHRQAIQVIWQSTRQQLAQQNSERIDITPHVDVVGSPACLLGTHVVQRALYLPDSRKTGYALEVIPSDSGEPEVEDLWLADTGRCFRDDQNIRRLEIAVDDTLLMSVMNGVAHADHQLDALAHVQRVPAAVRD